MERQHRGARDVQLFGNRWVRQPLLGQQQESTAEGNLLRRIAVSNQVLELPLLIGAHYKQTGAAWLL